MPGSGRLPGPTSLSHDFPGSWSSGLTVTRTSGSSRENSGTKKRGCVLGTCCVPDLMSLKRMMEKLGVPKTHLEMKKMISEVTGGVSDTISYRDFVNMMLGKRSAVLKLVMMFEGKANESSPKPAGPPPERDIASLP
ncbi:allograft inflammatory factor 1-like isoform X3 [Hippopotamus amphibius kiboko]|uniref:allograft inflammatory factor 1-like isoform X3 n=1 Tax=Hippopotamus amphibius kiboko TaxID=575201 RepID=UPI00259746CD|nr:allograft inflammatory factor 1-like isoform X3 [Hippopotamus amphibius kiboko]